MGSGFSRQHVTSTAVAVGSVSLLVWATWRSFPTTLFMTSEKPRDSENHRSYLPSLLQPPASPKVLVSGKPLRSSKRSNTMHDLDPELQSQHRAVHPGKVAKRLADGTSHVVRIVLTGGPGGGKSSALPHIVSLLTEHGFDVISSPEVATLIFNAGYKLPAADDARFPTQLMQFQIVQGKLLLQFERHILTLAASTGRPTVVLFDRGILDTKGYVDEAEWAEVLGQLVDADGQPVNEDYCLHRYDGCLHLVTAAEGAEDFYKHGDTQDDFGRPVYRRESPDEARQLDQRMRDCWAKHPNQHIVDNSAMGGFQAKVKAAAEAALKIALSIHPQERTKEIPMDIEASMDTEYSRRFSIVCSN